MGAAALAPWAQALELELEFVGFVQTWRWEKDESMLGNTSIHHYHYHHPTIYEKKIVSIYYEELRKSKAQERIIVSFR